MKTLIRNATIINEGRSYIGSVLIEGNFISAIYKGKSLPSEADMKGAVIMDASGQWLLPGVIDDQVHFREPGLTHKGCIASESRAAEIGRAHV